MLDGLWSLRLTDGPVPIVVFALSLVILVIVLLLSRPHRWGVMAIAAGCSAVLSWVMSWLVSDVWNSFGVSLSVPTRIWFTASVTAAAIVVVCIRHSGVGTKFLAAGAIPLCLLAGGIGINADVGEFPLLGDVLGTAANRPIALPSLAAPSSAEWVEPAGLPLHGRVGTVVIPAVVSHFAARKALVYLPPAALAHDAPALPVLELLSGQPGQPSNLVTSGQLPEILDAYAREHHGLAPIVVMPDQLGAPADNPMCVDSPLGNSATYLTVDVPRWINSHLRVLSGPRSWAIGGFSQGGTCSIQLGAKYPQLYGGILDISGQVAPHRGSVAATIHDGFDGSVAKYQKAEPLSLLAAGAPYRDTLVVFAVGAADARFAPGVTTIARGATLAGMRVHSIVSPGTAHDWHTVQYALRAAVPLFGAHWGLT